MNDPAGFEILAEIAIGLIGFAGVVVALGKTSIDAIEKRVRLRLLFLNGVVALWGGVSPSLAHYAFGPDSWRISGTLFLLAFTGICAYAYVLTFRRYRSSLQRGRGISIAIGLLLVVEFVYLLSALISFPAQIASAQYAGVLLMLFLGLYHFFALSMNQAGSEGGEPG